MEEENEFASYEKQLLLKAEIEKRENEYADIVTLTKNLCKSIELYVEKLDIKASTGYLILNSTNEKGVFEYDTMLVKMLDFLAEEMRLLGSRLDRFRKRIQDNHLLKYSKEDENIEELLRTCLEKVDYFNRNPSADIIGRDELEQAYKKMRQFWSQMHQQLVKFIFAAFGCNYSQIEPLFYNILNRYKEDNKAMLDNYMRDIDDIKEAKKELKNRLGSDKAVTIWENEGRNVVWTISEMNKQRYVERDLLPLLEYMAKYDRLTA